MPLSSVDDFCNFLQTLIQVHTTYLNKQLHHSIAIPLHYIQGILDSVGFAAFQAETDEWWKTKKILTNIAFLNFTLVDAALVVEVTLTRECPVTTWQFNLADQYVRKMIVEHIAVNPDKLDVRIPRGVLSGLNATRLLDELVVKYPHLEDLAIIIKKTHIVVAA